MIALIDNSNEREVLSKSFERSVRNELAHTPTDPTALRKLFRAAEWRGDTDLMYRALDVLFAVGEATPEEERHRGQLLERVVKAPSGVIEAEWRTDLWPRKEPASAALSALVWESVAELDWLSPASYQVGRGELVSPKQESLLRNTVSAWAHAFGSDIVDLYVGGPDARGVATMPGKKGPTWVVGTAIPEALDVKSRFLVGQLAFAMAEGILPVVLRTPDDAATILYAAAAAGDSALLAGQSRTGLAELTKAVGKKMPRRVRKAVAPIATRIPDAGVGVPDFCEAAHIAALRAGLLAAGELGVVLEAILGRDVGAERALGSNAARDSDHVLALGPRARRARALGGVGVSDLKDDDPTPDPREGLEWDDALQELEAEIEERQSKPQGEGAGAPKQPIYRPKEPDDTEEDAGRQSTPGTSSLFDFDSEYGDMEETRLSDPPKKLLEALEADQTKQDAGFDEMDIDALLDGLEMKDPEPVPAPAPAPAKAPVAPAPKAPAKAEPAAAKPPARKPWAPPPPKPRTPRAPKRPYQPPAPKGASPAGKPPPLPKSPFKPKPPPGAKPKAPAKPPPLLGRARPDEPAPPPGAVVARIKPRRIAPAASEEADERTPVVNLQEIGPTDASTNESRLSPDPRREPDPLAAADATLVDFGDEDEDDDVLPTRVAPLPELDALEATRGSKPPPLPGAHDEDEDDDDILPTRVAPLPELDALKSGRGSGPPPLPTASDDDDEPDIVVGEATGDLSDLDDLDDYDDDGFDYIDDESTQLGFAPASEAPAASASIIPPEDAGAQAAARTVRYRKPRREFYPLVGRDIDAMHARRELLRTLAEGAEGAAKARLLVATAELCEQLGEAEHSTDLYRDAHDADPSDVVALRALRRDALQRGEWQAAAALLEEETNLPLSSEARAAAFTLLAEIQLTRQGDAEAAQKSARSALGLDRSSVSAALLLAETGLALGRDAEALTAVEKAAASWEDGGPRSALLSFVGLAAERAGRNDKALEVFAQATEADPDAFDAMLGLARAQRAAKDLDATVIATARAGEHAGESPLAEAYRRASARIVHLMGKRPPHATALLFDAKGVLAHRARADAARDAGDPGARAGAIEAWAAAAGGTERALALTTLAEIRADQSDFEGAAAALRDAALADNNLNMIRLVRELLSRRAGSGSSLARADEGLAGTASISAAKAVLETDGTARERALLEKAQQEGDAPATADVIALDFATAASDADAILSGLGREVERASGEQKLGPLLCLAAEARVRGDAAVAEALLEQAREVRQGSPVVLRTLARQTQASSPAQAAQCWLEEAAAATEGRAAFAAVAAGDLLANAGQEPDDAFERALAAVPAYGPAAWALEPLIRARGDADALASLNIQLAQAASDPVEQGGRYVRAALLSAQADPRRRRCAAGPRAGRGSRGRHPGGARAALVGELRACAESGAAL